MIHALKGSSTSTSSIVLEARDVSKIFGDKGEEVVALRDVNLNLRKAEIVSIVGPSGCGKTTLLRLLAQLQRPTEGSIFLSPSAKKSRPTCSFVFQKTLLFPWRTAAENIFLPHELNTALDANVRARCKELIDAVGLTGFESAYPSQLSGGMSQRVNIARALINNPDIVYLDEPLSAVDEITRERLWVDFRRLWRERGVSALLVTHSIREAVFFSQRTLVMTSRPGTIAADINIDLPEHRSAETLYQPEFAAICERVREALVSGIRNS